MPTPQRLPIVNQDDGTWGDILRQYLMKEHYDDGNPTGSPGNGGHQFITIRAGVATSGGAPITFTSGTLLSTAAAGAMEFAGDFYYVTDTSGPTRRKIAAYDDTSGATGDIYYRNASGYFTRLAIGSGSNFLTVSGSPAIPTWSSTLSSATIDNTNTVTIKDASFTLQDNTTPSKQMQFELSGISTSTTRTLTVPDADLTIVGTTTLQTLANKTLTTPTIASFTNATHDHTNAAGGGQLNPTTALNSTGTPSSSTFLRGDNTWAGGVGDASTNTATSVDSEVAVFSGTGGKTLKRATGTGIAKLTSGVLGTATAGTDYQAVISATGILKGAGAGSVSAATAGTDYSAGTSALGTGIVKSTTGTGALTIAVAGDFPVLNQSTTGTAANLSGTPALPNGTTATTQSAGDNSTKLATTAYTDGAVTTATQSGNAKPTATVVATSALPAGTYSNGGSGGAGATFTVTATGTTTIDGHVLAANELVLVVAQASGFQNGLYTVTTAGTAGVSTVLTRSTSMDTTTKYVGAVIHVGTGGTTYADTIWFVTNTSAPTVGTTSITFSQQNFNLSAIPLTGTTAQFNAALSDNDFATLAGAEALTNKTINKVTLTAPATGSTLTIADGKTFTANASLTLAGTDGQTMTFPTTSATIARTDAAQTFTGIQTLSSAPVLSTGTVTVGGNTVTIPSATDTLVGKATTDILTNKTFDTAGTGNSFKINGTAITAVTGTGAVVLATGNSAGFTGALAGDVSGTQGATSVDKVKGVAMTSNIATLVSQMNGATTRSATATLVAGEQTVFTGSTGAQTLTLPASPQASSINTITNIASVTVTLAAGAGNTINSNGTVGSITVPVGGSYSLVFIGTVWYVTNLDQLSTTGSGSTVLATSPALTTPNLGTPSAATLTNATGLPISTGVSGLAAGVATFLGTPSSANLASAVTDETGSGSLVFATSPALTTPNLGTPSAATLTNATGLPISTGVSGLATGVATFLGTPSSANLAAAVTDETGTGSLVFGTSPTLTTPNLGTPSAITLTNATGLPLSGDVSGTQSTTSVDKVKGVAFTAAAATIASQLSNASARSATATLAAGEETVFTGSTAAQTLTLPTSPQSSTINTITNLASVTVTLAPGGANTLNYNGVTGNITVPVGGSFTVVYISSSTTWYVISFDQLSSQGTGATVYATSPTLTTPNLGTPSAINLTNATAASLPLTALAASTSTAIGVGSIELGNASDTTLSRSSAGVLAVEGVVVPRKFTQSIGNGASTSIAVTHNLGTQDVTWSIYDASTFEFVDADVTSTSTTQITFVFQTAPATNAFKVVIIG